MKFLIYFLNAFGGFFLAGSGASGLSPLSPVCLFNVPTLPHPIAWTAGIGAIVLGLFILSSNIVILLKEAE